MDQQVPQRRHLQDHVLCYYCHLLRHQGDWREWYAQDVMVGWPGSDDWAYLFD